MTIWRPPSLRVEQRHGPAASWTELFYDLVFVVAVASLVHRFEAHPDLARGLEFAALFAMLWWAWASVTFLVDRYESNDLLDRLLAVAQMVAVAAFAAAVADAEAPLASIAPGIAASYTATRLVLIAMYGRVYRELPESRQLVGGYLIGFGIDTALWGASIFVPSTARYTLWILAMSISLLTPWLMRAAQARAPLSVSHLPERFGLFTILVLGEAITGVVASFRSDAPEVALTGMLLAVGVWWLYFDNLEGSVVRRDPTRRHDLRPTIWIYAHLPLALCIAMLGGALAGAGGEHPDSAYSVIAAISLAGALVAEAAIIASTASGSAKLRHRRAVTRAAGALLTLCWAYAGSRVSPVLFLGVLGAILVAEAAFDAVSDKREPLDAAASISV